MNITVHPLPSRFAAVIVVWGQLYIERFLNVTLPSLLAEGNLMALRETAPFTLHLYAFTEELDRYFAPHPVWKSFVSRFQVHHEPLEKHWKTNEVTLNDRYLNMIAAHNHFGHIVSAGGDTAMIYLAPDVLYSNQFFSFLLARFREGYRAIMFNGLRVLREPVMHEIAKHYSEDRKVLSISSSEVINIYRLCEHPVFKLRYIGRQKVATNTSLWFWSDSERNLVLRSFHWLPLMIWPEASFDYLNNPATIDTHYGQSVLDGHQIYFQRDMRDFVGLDLADETLVDGTDVFDCGGSFKRYANHLGNFMCRFDIRVQSNILFPTVIASKNNESANSSQLRSLIRKSLIDAQELLTIINREQHSALSNSRDPITAKTNPITAKTNGKSDSFFKAKMRRVEQKIRKWRKAMFSSSTKPSG